MPTAARCRRRSALVAITTTTLVERRTRIWCTLHQRLRSGSYIDDAKRETEKGENATNRSRMCYGTDSVSHRVSSYGSSSRHANIHFRSMNRPCGAHFTRPASTVSMRIHFTYPAGRLSRGPKKSHPRASTTMMTTMTKPVRIHPGTFACAIVFLLWSEYRVY